MRWVVFFVVLLSSQSVLACVTCDEPSFLRHVTLTNPASYRLVYTGIPGLLLDEYADFVGTKWLGDIAARYDGDIRLSYKLLEASNLISDFKAEKYADKRKHWWHFSRHWNWTATYATGPSKDVINIGPFRVNRKFKFKLKHYTADIDNHWTFKFRPSVSFASKLPFIKTALLQFVFTYRRKRKKLFRITLSAGADFKQMVGEVSIYVDLLGWGS